VPVVPGYTGEDQDPPRLAREAERIGFPLMIKAAHGGGGKGMRIVRHSGEFAASLDSCRREAQNAFGRDRVLLERYIERPRHIEFQVFGDRHGNLVHLNERECSAQRRYQKVLEESPSPFLTPDLRTRMGEAAVAAARTIGYTNAGTVEFIVGEHGDFYFMEINTRLQVEPAVTEMVLNLDLVELQLRVAAGEPLPASLVRNKSLPSDGHAIEVRLYAEDPQKNFLPGSGCLTRLRLPAPSAHVRVDAGVCEGDEVTIFYDPMIAKLIVHDRVRAEALERLREALAATLVDGPASNIAFLERLVRHPAVTEGRIDTGYLDRHLDEFLPGDAPAAPRALLAAACAVLLTEETETTDRARTGKDPFSPWAHADGWRLGHPGKRIVALEEAGRRHEFAAHGSAGTYAIDSGPEHHDVCHAVLQDGMLHAEIDGIGQRWQAVVDADAVQLHDGTRRFRFARAAAFSHAAEETERGDRVVAPMPGRIVLLRVSAGDRVEAGQEVAVMEAMKMELTLRAPRAGRIAAVQVAAGEFVDADAVLIRLGDD